MFSVDTELTDTDVRELFNYSEKHSIVYDSLLINTASLSDDSIQLISQMARQDDTSISKPLDAIMRIDHAMERCHFCTVY